MRQNLAQNTGYGLDQHCSNAAALIRSMVGQPNADVHFIPGGTQTNCVACSVALRPWEAVVATRLGHISTHETGAIEATGHKVIEVPTADGKLRVSQIQQVLQEHSSEHMVVPRMVYISNTTEVGTQYTKAEVEELSIFCREHQLYFFMDGARLASALASPVNDLTLADIAALTDMFYIGATKVGGLLGEALVITNDALKPNVRHIIKRQGALMAKGWLIGIQFETLLEKELMFTLGSHANRMAAILKSGLEECGIRFAWDSCSNQLFPIFPNAISERLRRTFSFSTIEVLDGETSVVRLCTSWATVEEECHRFVEVLKTELANTASSTTVAAS